MSERSEHILCKCLKDTQGIYLSGSILFHLNTYFFQRTVEDILFDYLDC